MAKNDEIFRYEKGHAFFYGVDIGETPRDLALAFGKFYINAEKFEAEALRKKGITKSEGISITKQSFLDSELYKSTFAPSPTPFAMGPGCAQARAMIAQELAKQKRTRNFRF